MKTTQSIEPRITGMARIPILSLSVFSVKSVVENGSEQEPVMNPIIVLQEPNQGQTEDLVCPLFSLGSSPVINNSDEGRS